MEQNLGDYGGWVVTAERLNGRSGKRHYLVAEETKEAAVTAAQKQLGKEFQVEIGGPAAAIHFKRRNIKNGDVFELGSRAAR